MNKAALAFLLGSFEGAANPAAQGAAYDRANASTPAGLLERSPPGARRGSLALVHDDLEQLLTG